MRRLFSVKGGISFGIIQVIMRSNFVLKYMCWQEGIHYLGGKEKVTSKIKYEVQ